MTRRSLLRATGGLGVAAASGALAGCLGRAGGPDRVGYPLDRDDPSVGAARRAEAAAYDHYGLAFQQHFVEVPGLGGRLRVLEVGSGPPVVMIPGGVGYGVRWLPLLAELSGSTVYVMDRPGGGLSDGIDHGAMPLPDIAATSTGAVYDHFGLAGAPIVANSMGGYWSLRFAQARPRAASAIALLGCPATFPGEQLPPPARLMNLPLVGGLLVERILQPETPADVREGMRRQGHPASTAASLPEQLVEAAFRMERLPHYVRSWLSLLRAVTALVGEPAAALRPADLASIEPPVQLIWGREDAFGGPEVGRAGAAHFPDAAFTVAGVGHLPWLDAPRECATLVADFLTDRA